MKTMARVFSNYANKDWQMNNLVIHNLPEANGSSQAEQSSRNIKLFQDVMNEMFRVSVTISRSFRVGKTDPNRDRLLIVTLEAPR